MSARRTIATALILLCVIPAGAVGAFAQPDTDLSAVNGQVIKLLTAGSRQKRGKPVVMIDAGHGGIDPGVNDFGILEKDLTLDYALKIAEAIKKGGACEVNLTRSGDDFVSIDKRIAIVKEHKALLLISLKPENICAQPKPCYKIETCAEAYYRYTTCNDRSLDDEPLGPNVPHKQDQPNGIPCEKKCGTNALTMANKIMERPFSPSMRSETVCSPAN